MHPLSHVIGTPLLDLAGTSATEDEPRAASGIAPRLPLDAGSRPDPAAVPPWKECKHALDALLSALSL